MTNHIIERIGLKKDQYSSKIKCLDKDIFIKDPINMLKIVTIISKLNLDIDEETKNIIKENSHLLSLESGEKIGREILEILNSKKSYYYMDLMNKELNILDKIFPEVNDMKSVGECKYHVVDVLTHSIYTLKIAESVIYSDDFFENHIKEEYEKHCSENIGEVATRLQLIKLGALFHDIGKPAAKIVDETGRTRFRGHEIVGAQILADIGSRFNFGDREKEILYKYAALHMGPLVIYKHNDVSGQNLYKMFSKSKHETLDILLIGYSDIVATRKLLNPKEEMGVFKVHIEYIANNYITRYKKLLDISEIVDREDIITVIGANDLNLIDDIIEEVRKGIYLEKIPKNRERVIEYISKILR